MTIITVITITVMITIITNSVTAIPAVAPSPIPSSDCDVVACLSIINSVDIKQMKYIRYKK